MRKQQALTNLLLEAGLRTIRPIARPRLEMVSAELTDEIFDLYRTLGGRLARPRLLPGSWDISLADNLAIELDEQLHFNRYRTLTLTQSWASPLPWRVDYLKLCLDREATCLRASHGGKWTNPSCETMFGPGDPIQQLGSRGAPRWKQRALYDAMKDAYALSNSDVRLARISTHDVVNGVVLSDILEGRTECDLAALVAHIKSRTASTTKQCAT